MECEMKQVYLWTEALGCAEILPPMLSSYTKHHDVPIHVFVYEEDLHYVSNLNGVIPEVIDDSEESLVSKSALSEAYNEGHKGTALLWSHIIDANKGAFLIHLDADTIFLGDVVSEILNGLNDAGVVGTRRPYRRTVSRNNLRKLHLILRPDAVNTHAFGFRSDFNRLTRLELFYRILARNRRFPQRLFSPVIDFFDPLTFYIRRKSGIHYLDSKNQARSGEYSRYGNFEKKMISFAAVGSGYAFFHGLSKAPSIPYEEFAISSYSLYSKYLLGKELEATPLKSDYLEDQLKKLDVSSWTID
jgi:hypothetical protein